MASRSSLEEGVGTTVERGKTYISMKELNLLPVVYIASTVGVSNNQEHLSSSTSLPWRRVFSWFGRHSAKMTRSWQDPSRTQVESQSGSPSGNGAHQKQWLKHVLEATANQSNTCSVCMDIFREGQHARALPCGHLHHLPCIDSWLVNCATTCPVWYSSSSTTSFQRGMTCTDCGVH